MTRSRIGRLAGKNVRKLRKARGWSCEDLGRRIGLTRGGISAIEVGRVSPPLETCERIARAFDVPISRVIPMERRAALNDKRAPKGSKKRGSDVLKHAASIAPPTAHE